MTEVKEGAVPNQEGEAQKTAQEESESVIHEEANEPQGSYEEPVEEVPNRIIENKHDAALELVKEAKLIVKLTDEQMQACKLLLSDDLKEYEEAKSALFEHSLKKSESLLEEFGELPSERDVDEDFVIFESKDEINPMEVQDISSGKFTGVLLSLIAGFATLLGLLYVATEKLGTTLRLDHVPSLETISPILAWFSTPLTGNADFNIGTTVVAVSVVVVMAVVYLVRVKTKANANLKFATQQLADAQAYSEAKGDCKTEMEKVDKHINESINALNLYQVLLNEQNGKLERIRYIEAEKITETLHPKSLAEVVDTENLLETIHLLMETPMSEEGKLSSKSALVLRRTQEKAEEFIGKLY